MDSWQILAASKVITLYSSQSKMIPNPHFQYNPHRGIVNCAVFNHTNKVIASSGQDGKISLHSSASPKDKLTEIVYNSISQEPSSINTCLFSPKSKFIAAGSVNSTVKVWDMKNIKERQPMKKLKGHVGAITSLSWVNHQQIIASSSTCGDVYLHDVMTGAIRETFSFKMQQGINQIRVSEGESFKRLASCTSSGSIMVWDLNSNSKKPIYLYQDSKKASISSISISAYKPVLMASASIDQTLTFSDIQQKKIVKTVATDQPLTSVSFHNNGQIIAAGGMNGGIMLYDLRKLSSPMLRLNGHDTPIKSICFADRTDKYNIPLNKQTKQSVNERQKSSSEYYFNNPKPGASSKSIKDLSATQKSTTNIQPNKESQNKDPVNKSLTPVASTSKIGSQVEDEEKPSRGIRNLARREDNYTHQEQSRTVQNLNSNKIGISSNTVNNITSHIGSGLAATLEQKIMQNNMELRMEMHERFDGLHLEIIKQMQNMLTEVGNKLEASNNKTRQLEEKVKILEMQNQALKKRTY